MNEAPDVVAAPTPLPDISSVFVGRQREMGELRKALEDVLSGQGRLVMLAGEPGIGKTRTAEELEIYAAGQGFQVLWGRCYEGEGSPPYWPWIQPLRDYVQQASPDHLLAQMGPGAADIAEILPELRDKLPDLQPPPSLEPEQARFRLFDSITKFLKNSAQRQPLVLVLDDLHWADRSSLLLLEFLVREIGRSRLLLLGTYRDMELSRQHPLAETLGELTRQRLSQRLLLRGLGQEDTARLFETATDLAPPPGLVQTVHTQTDGNPLFVTEIVRLQAQEGELISQNPADGDSWRIRIPEGVREAIGRRLNRLSQYCNETLTLASVLGREFTLDQLQLLIEDRSEDRLLDVLEEALQAQVIEELPRAVGRYQFTHALIQETLAEELSLNRKVRLHASIAEALEILYGSEVGSHASELAHHFSQAEAVLGSEKLVKYSLLAGDHALGAYAYEEALSHFQRGLQAKGTPPDGTEPVRDGEEAALLFGLGRAQMTGMRQEIPGAINNLTRAFDYYAKVGDVDQAVAVAETPLPNAGGLMVGAAQLTARALELVPSDSRAAGRLLANSVRAVGIQEGDYERSQEMFQQAVTIARREQDTTLEAWALATAAAVDGFHLRVDPMLEKAYRALSLATDAGAMTAELHANLFLSMGLWARGDHEEAKEYQAKGMELAQQLGDRYRFTVLLYEAQLMAHLKGDYELAGQLSQRGLEVSERDSRMLTLRALLEHELGNVAEAEVFMERLLQVMRSTPPVPSWEHAFPAIVIPMLFRTSGSPNLLDTAQEAAQTVLAFSGCTPIIGQVARIGLALQAIIHEDVRAGNEHYLALSAIPSQIESIPICVDRVLGLLCHLTGHLDKGIEHFQAALNFCRQRGYRPELAWTCCDYADTLLQRGHPGDEKEARSLLEESLSLSTEMGMKPLTQRVQERMDRIDIAEIPAAAYPDGLTQREVEVLRLVAAGKNNREISEELLVSVGTVANHVTSILNKAGLNNRTEAAGYAIRQGLSQ
ncbi:MAG: helix-turn-helix transcriptional regulator [Dehalococcoidia bacterium]